MPREDMEALLRARGFVIEGGHAWRELPGTRPSVKPSGLLPETPAGRVHHALPMFDRPVHRYRSKTEEWYVQYLSMKQATGAIVGYWYEPLCLWLAPQLTYTPDFLTQATGQPWECWQERGVLRITPVFLTACMDLAPLKEVGLTLWEVKNKRYVFEQTRAYDRLKMAAKLYPMFQFGVALWDSATSTWSERYV